MAVLRCPCRSLGALAGRDLAFFGANALKFVEGGWFPLLIGGFTFTADGDLVSRPAAPDAAAQAEYRAVR